MWQCYCHTITTLFWTVELHTLTLLQSYYSDTHLFILQNNKFSKCLSDNLVRLWLIKPIRPAQLNSRSTAALADNAALSRTKSGFNFGHSALLMVAVSSDVECKYWSSINVWKSFRHLLVTNMSFKKCNEVKVQVFDQKSTSLQVKSTA